MAAGPGPRPGEPYLYLGDIGDNLDERTEIIVYRIPEPAAGGGGATVPTKAAPAATAPAEALRLRYPDGPHNAEALAVHPTTGDLYVITKDAQAARVYKAAAPLDPSKATTMIQVGTIRLGAGTRGLEQVTGADISPDGRRVALSTYAQGYELEAPAGGAVRRHLVAAAGAGRPRPPAAGRGHRLPPGRQGPAHHQRDRPVAPPAGGAPRALAAADVEAGGGQPLLDHLALLGAHLVARPLGHLDVEQVGGHDQRLVVAVEVELPDVGVGGWLVEPPAQVPQPLGQPLPLVVGSSTQSSLSS